VSGQICVSEGETVAASVRNCVIVSAINMSHETDDGEPSICIYAGKHPGAVQAVRESRLRGQRPPHLPGSRAPDEWLHDAARAVDGSAIVRPLRAALRCTGGGVDGRRAIAASHSPLHTTGLLYAIVPWRDIILSPTLRGWKRSLNVYHHACIPPGTRNGGRWKTMGSNLTAPRRRPCPSPPCHGLVGAQGARTDDAGVGRLRVCERVTQDLARGMSRRRVCGRSFSAGRTGQWAAECRREQRRRHWDARRIHRRASLLLQANCAASKTGESPDEAGGTREGRLVFVN